ncbi:PAS domain-containing sensor histidine kinase [Aliiglaciecola sp. M165]|uniref:sensor histidine kinase n=1 Tax=Aliiglaciecola sp. M165 TaxID=2593649 RepID=UPI00117C7495|nr:HAMP domain-containing histidine kinase [Aliiglaciecola sp. M165]
MALSSALHESFESIHHSMDYSASSSEDEPNDVKRVSIEEFEQLKNQATRLEHLLQVMPAGVVVVSEKGVVKQANALAKSLLGEPLEGQAWRNIIKRSFKPQADDGHEVSLHDGRKVKLSITPLKEEPGQLIVLTDLTETRQLQQRISHMQRLSSLGKTVASIVHQIRTPLSAAMLYASNLASNQLSDAARQRFSEKLSLRLKDLETQVNDMLLFAKSGEQQVVQSLSIKSLFEEVVTASDNMLHTSKGQLMVSSEHNDLCILGNKPALVGAIQNLVHNALQIQPKNPIVALNCRRQDDHLIVDVLDNGPGIDKKHLMKVFEPFYTTKSHGTGLGLAVVATVAKSHGGSVSVANVQDKGACFSIQLPIHNSGHESNLQGDKS